MQLVSQSIQQLLQSEDPERQEAGKTMKALFAKGYLALYGGSKGHGFWIRGCNGSVINSANGCNWWSVAQAQSLV